MHGSRRWTGWVERLPVETWSVFERFLKQATARRIPFSLAGAFATATHTGRWRGTNDMDVYVQPKDLDSVVRLTEEIGLKDMCDWCPYDRGWTYRASLDGNIIVEAISKMRNRRADVDEQWIARAEEVDLRGIKVRVTAPEEMLWPKLYVMHRDRCDWPDVLNLINACAQGLDWRHLLGRLDNDAPLLAGVLCVLFWLNPERASAVPEWVLQKLGLQKSVFEVPSAEASSRASLFKEQDWFGSPP